MDSPFSEQAKIDRKMGQRSLYYLCKEILGYRDMVPHVHGHLTTFLTNPEYSRFRQACVPRSFFKTWVGTIGGSIWLTLPDEEGLFKERFPYKGPDARILIASNISDNAEKMVDKIRHEWMDNERLRAAFPELIPDFAKTRWSNSCACLARRGSYTEGTYTSVGAGGGVISQHFDHIVEDDLVYAKKDDFSGMELLPNQEDIDKAIGWHKLAFSLLVNPKESGVWNIGTRWAPKDLINYIRQNEKHYFCFELTVTKKNEEGNSIWPITSDKYCVWPERYDNTALQLISSAQGPKLFETQYLCRPRAAEDVTFDVSKLCYHDSSSEFPDGIQWKTFVDLATWKDKKRICNNIVMTVGRGKNNHIYVARLDAGKYNPTEVIARVKEHVRAHNSKSFVEEVGYQVALRHFAKEEMERDGFWYSLEPLPSDTRKNAKELRINSLEPLVSNGALHILRSQNILIQELSDYPYSSTKDAIDVLGWGMVMCPVSEDSDTSLDASGFFQITRESIEKELAERAKDVQVLYPFSAQVGDFDYNYTIEEKT